ncbi:MAG: GTP-binding protein [Promethearchaeota archaeon]
MRKDLAYKIIIAGDVAVGKSSFLNQYVSNKFEFNKKTTIGIEFIVKNILLGNLRLVLQFWDFGGGKRFQFLFSSYITEAKGALLFFELTRPSSIENLEIWVNLIRSKDKKIPILLVGNKKDIYDNDDQGYYDKIMPNLLEKFDIFDYIYVSSKTGENVDNAVKTLIIESLRTYNRGLLLKSNLKFRPEELAVSFKNQSLIFPVENTEGTTEDYMIAASDLLVEYQSYKQKYKYFEAKKILEVAKNFSEEKNLEKYVKKISELEKDLDKQLIESKNKIIDNKKRIHALIYENKLTRCPLHEEIYSKCNKVKINKFIIEEPEIKGFFMYKFPNKDKIDYLSEIEKIKELIENSNEDPLIKIYLPSETMGFDVKTCDFCKIARTYDFGMLLLYPPNVNAYLEAGMFLSLGKKVILLNNEYKEPGAPFDLQPYFYLHYRNLEELENNWERKIPKYLNTIKNFYLEYR